MRCLLLVFFCAMVACSPAAEPELPPATAAPPPASQSHASTAAAPTSALPPGAIQVQPLEIIDAHGFGQNVVAAITLAPAGWRGEGGIDWSQNTAGCGPKVPHFAWQALSPDNISAVIVVGEETWSGNNLPNSGQQACPNVWIQSAKEYIGTWVEYNRPGARLLDYRDRDDAVAQLRQQMQQYSLPTVQGMETRRWIEAGQALIAYDYQGVDVRELIGIAVVFNLTRMQGVMPGEIQEYLSIETLPGYAMRAPAGQLDFKMAEMLRKSTRVTPEWSARMAQHNTKMTQIANKGAMERSRIIAQSNEEIRQIQQEGWRSANASRDRMHRESIETIRGVETYNDPYNGGTVELDNSYQHAWQLNDGSYVLTDDASFNPYAATGQDGRLLEATQ